MRNRIGIHKKLIIAGALLAAFFISTPGVFADSIGDVKTFFVNTTYDEFSRPTLSATLRNLSSKAYFYVDDRYWSGLNKFEKDIFTTNLQELARQFDEVIYPKETQFFGSEPNPGIDGDPRITVLAQDLIKGNGGYFETANMYSRKTFSESNEREMIAISVEAISSFGKVFLAHEFQHLISFNQKEMLRGSQEDIWLNELRSEYANTLVGYNDVFRGSNLERRLDSFNDEPLDSLVEWPNVSLDYAHVAIFAEYLTEQYGPSILSATLQNPTTGISSINNYLQSRNYKERFSDIFGSWTVANYLNNSSLDRRYGYQRSELRNIRVNPQQNFLSYPADSTFAYNLKPWQSTWYQYNFSSLPSDKAIKIDLNSSYLFKVMYADNLGRVGVLNSSGYITNPGGLRFVVLMPINESKTTDFGLNEETRAISIKIGYVDNASAQTLKDGSLIKRRGSEPETYVIEGKYKRYLRPEVIALYGHLDPVNAVEVDNETFNSYSTANYVRNVNQKPVYAVWPDGTKHWLNITPQQWDASGRDWNAIFIINDLELNYYKTGAEITR